jgi:hypothetical protein
MEEWPGEIGHTLRLAENLDVSHRSRITELGPIGTLLNI